MIVQAGLLITPIMFNLKEIEEWSDSIIKINDNLYRTKGKDQYWEFKLVGNEKLLMNEIGSKYSDRRSGNYYPFHKVDSLLTMDFLKKRLAKEMFAGNYKVMYHDTLTTDSIIILDEDFGVKGITGISRYAVRPDIDIDGSVPNSFSFFDPVEKAKSRYDNLSEAFSFSFNKDTLMLNGFDILRKDGDFDGYKITKPRVKLLKLK